LEYVVQQSDKIEAASGPGLKKHDLEVAVWLRYFPTSSKPNTCPEYFFTPFPFTVELQRSGKRRQDRESVVIASAIGKCVFIAPAGVDGQPYI